MSLTVLQTDRAWPDDSVERHVIEKAGMRLVAAPAPTGPEAIEALAREIRPNAIMTCWTPVTSAAVAAAGDNLRIVARMGVGLDNIAVKTATDRNVWVTNVPDYCVEEVSDHAVAMVLAWTRGLVGLDRQVREGKWAPAHARLRRLATLTCGIVGYGRIGRATARKLLAFGCKVLATTPKPIEKGPVDRVPLDELFGRCDVVIIHAPQNEATVGLIGRRILARMKRGGLLVNVSRGGIVDSAAISEALRNGTLDAAALDVLDSEPAVPPELASHPNVLFTPHVAFSSDASLAELRRRAAEEVVRVLSGQPPLFPCNSPATLRAVKPT